MRSEARGICHICHMVNPALPCTDRPPCLAHRAPTELNRTRALNTRKPIETFVRHEVELAHSVVNSPAEIAYTCSDMTWVTL